MSSCLFLDRFSNSCNPPSNPVIPAREGVAGADPFYACGQKNAPRDTVVAAGLACKVDRHPEGRDQVWSGPVLSPGACAGRPAPYGILVLSRWKDQVLDAREPRVKATFDRNPLPDVVRIRGRHAGNGRGRSPRTRGWTRSFAPVAGAGSAGPSIAMNRCGSKIRA